MTFQFVSPQSLDEALQLWQENTEWYAGGTELIPLFNVGLASPSRLVNLKSLTTLRGIQVEEDGVRIGALTTLAEVASHPVIQRHYRALAQACEMAATPQLRNIASIGGNVCQRSRCPYYRGAFYCWLKGGRQCFLREGVSRESAIIGYHDCLHVHPSDPANALVAFDATVAVRSAEGQRVIRADAFFRAPDEQSRAMTLLRPGEIITELRLPAAAESRSIYLKAMDRATWSFALASVAARLDFEGDRVADARVVLGGVAPIPWVAEGVRRTLRQQVLAPAVIDEAATDLWAGVIIQNQNGYKVPLTRSLVRQALLALV